MSGGVTNRQIIEAIEEYAPLSLQESWDNSGWQVGDPSAECRGVLLCVDLTPEVLAEAVAKGCDLVVTHHPLIFRGIKKLVGRDRVTECLTEAVRRGVSVYSSHTSTDAAPAGVSAEMARMLGLTGVAPLDASGLGAVGDLPNPLPWALFADKVKDTFGCASLRLSRPAPGMETVGRVALCGGAGGDFIGEAIEAGADVYVTADCKHNLFLDRRDEILLIDAGHFETEQCTKALFKRVISEKFPNFAVWESEAEENPVLYV
ncbi:MAG: Nif3-like dinuclear metal center hexameric protein [[Clostridium] fimetarium]|nr:Nif3-like dinuclear metal center hexameric protein [Alistipes timonensis]MCM1405971.1 Nif3-like dinuclear metal center hexameric protein [[Clostridium] fimetarium]